MNNKNILAVIIQYYQTQEPNFFNHLYSCPLSCLKDKKFIEELVKSLMMDTCMTISEPIVTVVNKLYLRWILNHGVYISTLNNSREITDQKTPLN